MDDKRRRRIAAEKDYRDRQAQKELSAAETEAPPADDAEPTNDEQDSATIAEPDEIAGIYRQLRSVLEEAKDYAGAGDFFYGEMEMRRVAEWNRMWEWGGPRPPRWRAAVDWFWIAMFRNVSGYGLRAWRALASLAVVTVIGGWLFHIGGLDILTVDENGMTTVEESSGFWETLWFAARSTLSFFDPPEGRLSVAQRWLQLSLRFFGPTFLALAVLAVRSRVRR